MNEHQRERQLRKKQKLENKRLLYLSDNRATKKIYSFKHIDDKSS